jgi:hypothetical protein
LLSFLGAGRGRKYWLASPFNFACGNLGGARSWLGYADFSTRRTLVIILPIFLAWLD